jgi:hypothetical protein
MALIVRLFSIGRLALIPTWTQPNRLNSRSIPDRSSTDKAGTSFTIFLSSTAATTSSSSTAPVADPPAPLVGGMPQPAVHAGALLWPPLRAKDQVRGAAFSWLPQYRPCWCSPIYSTLRPRGMRRPTRLAADAVENGVRGGHRAGSPAASLRPTASYMASDRAITPVAPVDGPGGAAAPLWGVVLLGRGDRLRCHSAMRRRPRPSSTGWTAMSRPCSRICTSAAVTCTSTGRRRVPSGMK